MAKCAYGRTQKSEEGVGDLFYGFHNIILRQVFSGIWNSLFYLGWLVSGLSRYNRFCFPVLGLQLFMAMNNFYVIAWDLDPDVHSCTARSST